MCYYSKYGQRERETERERERERCVTWGQERAARVEKERDIA